MFERIEKALSAAGVSVWNIAACHTKTAELYFIKKKLDLPRFNDILQYEVTVYRDAEENGKKLRGQSVTYIVPGMTDEEINRKIADAYFAAQFVKNPFYELPDKVTAEHKESRSRRSIRNRLRILRIFRSRILRRNLPRLPLLPIPRGMPS